MKNTETLIHAVKYIEKYMKKMGLNAAQVSNMSSTNDSEDKVTKRTVYNMFNDPTKSTISTLLKVCDTLNINLSYVFRAIDTSVTSVEA